MLYDEYLMSLPKYANHPFFEADNKKSFKDTLADAFNALLAIIRGLWKKITEFFKNAKFVKAADWVEKHKDELLKMNFASVEVKVVNYKKNINLPDGFDNIFQNMTKVPATAPTDAKAEPASQAWAQNLYPSPEIYQWFNASPEIGKIKYKNLIMFAENMQQANVDTTLEKEETITGQQINEMMVTWIENVTNHEALYKKWESINQSVETAIKTLKSTCDNRVAALQNTAPIPAAQAAAAASKPESPTPTTGTGESVYNQLNGRPYLEADDSTSTPAGGGTGENNNVDYKQKAKDIIGKMKGLWAQNYNDIRNGKPLVPESKMQEYNNLRTELTAIKDKLGPNDKVVNIDLYASEIPTALKAEQSSSTSGDTSTGDQGETSSEPAPSVEGRQPPENQQAEKDAAENDGGNGQTGTSEGETSGSGSTEQTQETEDDKKNAERDNAVTYYQSLVTRAQKAMLNLYTPVAGWICDMISDQYKYIQKAYNKAKGIADKTKEDNKADQRQLAVNAQNTGT
ncbi:MAG: hypothetical protein HDQ88_07505 [Clostridia bacterium]|nr:hypothetical protein [Clostridia bacterium]